MRLTKTYYYAHAINFVVYLVVTNKEYLTLVVVSKLSSCIVEPLLYKYGSPFVPPTQMHL